MLGAPTGATACGNAERSSRVGVLFLVAVVSLHCVQQYFFRGFVFFSGFLPTVPKFEVGR
jgi:hypothetical protein